MIRMNHAGVRMDTPDTRDTNDLGDVKHVWWRRPPKSTRRDSA
jgi:hypothetical protein